MNSALRAKLEEIADETLGSSDKAAMDRHACAMAALTHLASYEAQVNKFPADDLDWSKRRMAMEIRFVELLNELRLVVRAPQPGSAFELVPAA